MDKWAIVEVNKKSDWITPFDDKFDALQAAEKEWQAMAPNQRKGINKYLVGLFRLDTYGNLATNEIETSAIEITKVYN
ncbi:hypothetical protein M2146_001115 [Lachnospiraceae bacterium PF1-22]